MRVFKRSVSIMVVVLMLCSALSMGAYASVWRSGDFYQAAGWYTSWHTIYSRNSSAPSRTNVYAYACSRGTGHSGACRNYRSFGPIKVAVETTTQCLAPKTVWPSANGYAYTITTYGTARVRLTLGSNYAFQHWALDGVSNVSWIS